MTELKHQLTSTFPAGFSLLEVLVGLIILAIGLLGLAGLQMVSLRQNNEAYLRSQATLQAYDILDRMRGNRQRIQEYEIDFDELPDSIYARVQADLEAWKDILGAVFPGPGSGAISTNGTMVTVMIRWREYDNSDDPDDWTVFATQSEL